ncbi:MAG: GNAT family N-acetyltransferase [Armatimonadota bacterium]|jgi:GNAT superfamily N-acetyltransferase
MRPLDPQSCRALADALGDTPETVIPVHLLRRGLCRTYLAGELSRFASAIVQDRAFPTEPTAFGSDPEALWELLRRVEGWDCVNVSAEVAEPLAEIMAAEMGRSVRHYGDVYHTMPAPAPTVANTAVRRLTLADLELLESAPADVGGVGFGGGRALLSDGVVACGIVDGKIVAIAQTYALTERHVDIGVSTLEPWRKRGFATAAASVVARRVQEGGRTPVWSTGEDNYASLRVAEKLGFVEVGRRTYLIPGDGE